jgi:hypothetical protein
MPFVAECPFCRTKMRVPDHVAGVSYPCPTCGDSFTLAPRSDPMPGTEPPAALITRPFVVPEAPAEPKPQRDAPPETEDSFWHPPKRQVRWVEPIGLMAFACAAAGLLTSTTYQTQRWALPLAGLAAVLGGAGVCWAVARQRRAGLVWSGLGGTVGLALAVIILGWPWLLRMEPVRWRLGTAPAVGNPQALEFEPGKRSYLESAPEWLDASRQAFQQDDWRVRIISAEVAPVPYRNPPPTKTPDVALLITVRLSNVGALWRFEYQGWSEPRPNAEAAQLSDAKGKVYALRKFNPGQDVVGRVLARSLPPGRRFDDLLVFEAPPTDVSGLRLELPAAAVGLPGKVRFEIPPSLINRP